MRTCIIEVPDEVNVKLIGLDEYTLKQATDALTFTVKNSHFMKSVRMKHWNGKIGLLKNPSGLTYRHLLDKILPTILRGKYEIAIDDRRFDWKIEVPEIQNNLFEGLHHKRFKGIMDEHQVDAINKITSHNGGIIVLATGGGKTIITAGLAQLYYRYGKVLVIVPRQDLAMETCDTIRAMGMEDCGAYFADIKEPRHVTVTTWQSLDERPELFADVTMVLVDECHGADARVLHRLLTGPGKNVPIRIGMTGTMPTDDLSRYQIIAALGPVIYEKRARDLQKIGFLAKCKIFILKYLDKHRDDYRLVNSHHQYYTDEMRWQFECRPRIRHLAAFIDEISQGDVGGNTLVLVRYREYGALLHELIPGSVYLNGSDKAAVRHRIYRQTNEGNNAVLICTYGIASTGIDVARLFNLVLIEPGKETIPIIQSIGRGLRKAADKDTVMIYHVGSDAKFSVKHLVEVQKIYKTHQYPWELLEVDYS